MNIILMLHQCTDANVSILLADAVLVSILLANINVSVDLTRRSQDLSYLDHLFTLPTNYYFPRHLMDWRTRAHGLTSIPVEICAKRIDLECMEGCQHGSQTRDDIDTILGINSYTECLFHV